MSWRKLYFSLSQYGARERESPTSQAASPAFYYVEIIQPDSSIQPQKNLEFCEIDNLVGDTNILPAKK